MRALAVLVVLPALAAAGCYAKISGNLQVDGAPFAGKECRSGQAFGYSGIQFSESSGRQLRLQSVPDGTCEAALFSPGAAVGENLGPCGLLKMQAQASRVRSVHNLRGTATLSCQTSRHQVSGQVEFENCH